MQISSNSNHLKNITDKSKLRIKETFNLDSSQQRLPYFRDDAMSEEVVSSSPPHSNLVTKNYKTTPTKTSGFTAQEIIKLKQQQQQEKQKTIALLKQEIEKEKTLQKAAKVQAEAERAEKEAIKAETEVIKAETEAIKAETEAIKAETEALATQLAALKRKYGVSFTSSTDEKNTSLTDGEKRPKKAVE